jgi:hypothetical protein
LPGVWTPDDVACYFRLPSDQVQGVVCTDSRSSRELLATLFDRAATAPGFQS